MVNGKYRTGNPRLVMANIIDC